MYNITYNCIHAYINGGVWITGMHLMRRSPSTFQLLGLDLMVTTDWRIWFIESNNYPLWPQGGWITEFTGKMGVSLAMHDAYSYCSTGLV